MMYDEKITLREFRQFKYKLNQELNTYRSKKIFLSPVDRAMLFENVFNESSLLRDSLTILSTDLIKILFDKKIKKDKEFNYDIIRMLYHLCAKDYSCVLESIYHGYCRNQVDIEILLYSVITFNDHYSNLIVNNYNHQKINGILKIMLENKIFITEAEKKYPNFNQLLLKIQNGSMYDVLKLNERDWFFSIKETACQ